MKKYALALTLTALTGAAHAQGIQIINVTGSGTVASGSQASGVSANMALAPNSTVTAAQGGSITIQFPSGCVATVTAAAPFIANEANCQTLATASNTQAPAAGGGNLGVLAAAGVGAGLAIHHSDKNNSGKPVAQNPISPR